jgi:hypothetical protein
MATLPKVLISRADYQIGGGVALGLKTQGPRRKNPTPHRLAPPNHVLTNKNSHGAAGRNYSRCPNEPGRPVLPLTPSINPTTVTFAA